MEHEVRGKVILLRVDLNCPVENGKITGSSRISAHSKTIRELSERGAKVVILSHQGRKGHDDFIGLEQHSKLLEKLLDLPVTYIDQVVGPKSEDAIKNLKNGQIIILDNVRVLHCETEHPHGEGEIVAHLGPISDYYVLDALSVAHRKHSSVVGFSKRIPCFAGDVLAGEIEAVKTVSSSNDVTFIFGGSKVEDSFAVMKKWLEEGKAKKVLVGGALAVLLLKSNGNSIGNSEEYLNKSGLSKHVAEASEMLRKFSDRIVLPVDVGLNVHKQRVETDSQNISNGEIWDIGEKTIEEYKKHIRDSKVIVMNGPAGVYEMEAFSKGTKALLEAVSESKAFSLLGGGHTVTAIERFGIDKKKYGYVSLSGKALIEFLCGKTLPGIAALEESHKKFEKV